MFRTKVQRDFHKNVADQNPPEHLVGIEPEIFQFIFSAVIY